MREVDGFAGDIKLIEIVFDHLLIMPRFPEEAAFRNEGELLYLIPGYTCHFAPPRSRDLMLFELVDAGDLGGDKRS